MATEQEKIWRPKVRLTLFFIDLIVYALNFWIIVGYSISDASHYGIGPARGWGHFILAGLCIFISLFAGKIYNRILRYGNVGAHAAFVFFYLVGGAVYFCINLLFRFLEKDWNISILRAVVMVLSACLVSEVLRMGYTYFFYKASSEDPAAPVFRRLLVVICHVDAKSLDIDGTVPITEIFQPFEQTMDPINELQGIVRNFRVKGRLRQIRQITRGYINRTYYVETVTDDDKHYRYILQRINTNVFKDVDALMVNFALTSKHLKEKEFKLPGGDSNGSIAELILTGEDENYLKTDSGTWRMTTYFDHVHGMNLPDSKETFYYAGRAFGTFMKGLSDIPINQVKITIPDFHNACSRYEKLEKSVAADKVKRVREVEKEIEFVRQEKDAIGKIHDALVKKEIPMRICHNDCNLNNVLFDDKTKLPVAVIDLDTVMPSSPLYDYGDSMRAGTNTAADDEKDLSKVQCDLQMYEQYARGYLEACGDILTTKELELLPYAAPIITIEDGIRFLTDHIDGDIYFNIFYAGQNLDRARTQLKLYEDMKNKLPEIKKILQKIYDELGLPGKVVD